MNIHESIGSVRINRAAHRLQTDLKQTNINWAIKTLNCDWDPISCLCLITLTEEDSRRPQDGDEDWEILRTVGSEHDEKMKQLLIISHVVEEVFRSLTWKWCQVLLSFSFSNCYKNCLFIFISSEKCCWHKNVKTSRVLCSLFHLNIVHFGSVKSLKMKCAKLFSLLFHSAFSFQLQQCLLKGKHYITLHSNDVLLCKSRCSNEDAVLFMSFEYCPPHTAGSLFENETSFPFSF